MQKNNHKNILFSSVERGSLLRRPLYCTRDIYESLDLQWENEGWERYALHIINRKLCREKAVKSAFMQGGI